MLFAPVKETVDEGLNTCFSDRRETLAVEYEPSPRGVPNLKSSVEFIVCLPREFERMGGGGSSVGGERSAGRYAGIRGERERGAEKLRGGRVRGASKGAGGVESSDEVDMAEVFLLRSAREGEDGLAPSMAVI